MRARARAWIVRAGVLAIALALVDRPATAFDTATKSYEGGTHAQEWLSIFIKWEAGGHDNEHSVISHTAVSELGLHELGFDGLARGIPIFDLNSAIFNEDLHPNNGAASDNADSQRGLELRFLPPPAHFSGMPDYSFNITDWIYKNTSCPLEGVPSTDPACHQFQQWMGALNANHFGSMAEKQYKRSHATALWLAERARRLRADVLRTGQARRVYRKYLQEAQWEALAYEGYGQHFLQDRWSMGHMWERWGGADVESMDLLGLLSRLESHELDSHLLELADDHFSVLGNANDSKLLAGLIHGSQSVTKIRDEMCSPNWVTGIPVTWLSDSAGGPYPGVGDHRLLDGDRGLYTTMSGVEVELDVREDQFYRMYACSRDGWASVVEALEDPTMNMWEQPRISVANRANPEEPGGQCWDHWATNHAIATGLYEETLTKLATVARWSTGDSNLFEQAASKADIELLALNRASWMRVAAGIAWHATTDPFGTSLARGSTLPVFGITPPGNRFDLPSYAEPANLYDLPEVISGEPRSVNTIAGFFNRAHADWWCARPMEISVLRIKARYADPATSEGQRTIEACAMLADRFYEGTLENGYSGVQQERRRVPVWDIDPVYGVSADTYVPPICSLFAAADPAAVPPLEVRPDTPVRIHQGYVSNPGSQEMIAVFEGKHAEFSESVHASIVAWCRMVPVLDPVDPYGEPCSPRRPPATFRDADVVGVATQEGGRVRLTGQNLSTVGTITARQGSTAVEMRYTNPTGVYSTEASQIWVEVPPDMAPGDWYLEVEPMGGHGTTSVGVFILRVHDAIEEPVITDLTVIGALVPGETFEVEVDVLDCDGAPDLIANDAFVELRSPVIAGGDPIKLVKATQTSNLSAKFTGVVQIEHPLDDRSNDECTPHDYVIEASAQDSSTVGAVSTSQWFERFVSVENVAPEIDTRFGAARIAVEPGASFDLVACVADGNYDQTCDELPEKEVEVSGVDGILETTTPLGLATWEMIGSCDVGVAMFQARVTVKDPHVDHEGEGEIPVKVSASAADDRQLSASGEIAHVTVENIAPTIENWWVWPQALHPGARAWLTIDIEVGDKNFPRDVEHVWLDLSQLGISPSTVEATAIDKVQGAWRWQGIVQAPTAKGTVAFPIWAADDDGAYGLGTGSVLIENVPPIWPGWIQSYLGGAVPGAPPDTIYECQEVTLGASFGDPNADALRVYADLTGPRFHQVVDLPKLNPKDSRSTAYGGRVNVGCAGTYQLVYTAEETSTKEMHISKSMPTTFEVTANPRACPACHLTELEGAKFDETEVDVGKGGDTESEGKEATKP